MQQTIIICDGGETGGDAQCSKTAVVRVQVLAQAGSFVEVAQSYDACAGHIGDVVQMAWVQRTKGVIELRQKERTGPRSWQFTRIQVIEISTESE